MPETKPWCAVCKKPVEETVMWRDEAMQETVYQAYCHGSVQEVRLEDTTLAGADRISLGEAFAFKALPNG